MQQDGKMKLGYARVSTQEQNLDLQLDALKEAGCERIYSEKISAVNPYKPELEKLLEHARAGDVIVVWKLDRLDRQTIRVIEFASKLKSMNIHIQSLTESIDTSSPTGEVVFHIFAVLAQHEKNMLLERTLAGQKAAREKGKHMGRKPSLSNEQWKAAKKLLLEDQPVSKVAEIFNVSRDTIYRYQREENKTA